MTVSAGRAVAGSHARRRRRGGWGDDVLIRLAYYLRLELYHLDDSSSLVVALPSPSGERSAWGLGSAQRGERQRRRRDRGEGGWGGVPDIPCSKGLEVLAFPAAIVRAEGEREGRRERKGCCAHEGGAGGGRGEEVGWAYLRHYPGYRMCEGLALPTAILRVDEGVGSHASHARGVSALSVETNLSTCARAVQRVRG